MNDPLVSVVVPTYGRSASHLRTAVESVRAQRYEPVELVVVDDSPDGVAEWITDAEGFAATRRVTSDGDGPGAARNAGITASEGSVIAFLDDDDWWEPEKLTAQVERLREPEVGVVHTGLRRVRNATTMSVSLPVQTDDPTRAILAGRELTPFSAVAVTRAAAQAAGPIDERLGYMEDREWYLRLSLACRFAAIRRPLAVYRHGDHDQLTDEYQTIRESIRLFRAKHQETAARRGVEDRFRAALAKSLATSALRARAFGDARRYALRAVLADPGFTPAYAILLAALGGPWSYRPLRGVRRAVARAQAMIRE